MLRGETCLVDLDPVLGSEANERRPAVVVSNDHANAAAVRSGRGVLTVVPSTSSISRVWPFQVLLPAGHTGLERDSKARAEQVRSVAVQRVGAVLGRVGAEGMAEVDEALRLHLAL